MRSSPLAEITGQTLGHYNDSADAFRDGTRDHDVSQNIEALLRHLDASSALTILDFGCGPGRDLRAFSARGHYAIGLDGAERFVAMARSDSACEVWHQDFLQLDLPPLRFDGIFANASLFHVPLSELPRVLSQLHASLKPGGALFSSIVTGAGSRAYAQEPALVLYGFVQAADGVLPSKVRASIGEVTCGTADVTVAWAARAGED